MSEQRKKERKLLTTFTPVYDLHKNSLLGYLRDLTLQGAMIVGNKAMEINKNYTLGIEFQATPETPATRMVIPTRVAWCRREEDSTYYNTGVEFLELIDKNKLIISAFLERYQLRKEPPT